MNNLIYRMGENIVFRNTRPDLVMAFDKGSGVMYELNDTATSVLKLIDGHRDIDSIVTALTEEFEADPEQIRADVVHLLQRFAEVSLVVPA